MMIFKTLRYNTNAFTLVELLVALMVTGIILAAIAALASALGGVNDSCDEAVNEHAHLRYAALKIRELIKHCKLIGGTSERDIAVWRKDDNEDSQINPSELVYIESGFGGDYIRLLDFEARSGWFVRQWYEDRSFSIEAIESGLAKVLLSFMCKNNYTNLMPQCSNVEFSMDAAAPETKFVNISFDLQGEGLRGHYELNASLMAWAGKLLDDNGEIIAGE